MDSRDSDSRDSFVRRQGLQSSRSSLFIKLLRGTGLLLLFVSLVFGGWWRAAYASQQTGDSANSVVQAPAGIKGYVVGNSLVAAYSCPDTVKCQVKATLKPGTIVLIVDNVVGATVPGLNDNAWRKIVYQGLTLFVPQAYIRVGTPSAGNGPDVSLVQTSFEDDSTGPNPTSSSVTAPPGIVSVNFGFPPPPPFCSTLFNPPNYHVSTFNGVDKCCPPGLEYNGTECAPTGPATFYHATDGRISGNPGDRIAIYCRKTGRIEVWSINNIQGLFLVSFNHLAVDAAGKAGFSVAVPLQGVIVTINGDGHGTYWASIHGGLFHATGAGDFAKTFQCYMQS